MSQKVPILHTTHVLQNVFFKLQTYYADSLAFRYPSHQAASNVSHHCEPNNTGQDLCLFLSFHVFISQDVVQSIEKLFLLASLETLVNPLSAISSEFYIIRICVLKRTCKNRVSYQQVVALGLSTRSPNESERRQNTEILISLLDQ